MGCIAEVYSQNSMFKYELNIRWAVNADEQTNVLSRKAPRFWEDVVFLRKHFTHSVQVTGKQIFPTNFIHARKVIYFLK